MWFVPLFSVDLSIFFVQKPLHDTVAFRKEADGVIVDVALQW